MSNVSQIVLGISLTTVSLIAFVYALTLAMTGGTGEDKLAREHFRERNRRIAGEGHMLLSRAYFETVDAEEVDAYIHHLDKEIARTEKRIKRYQRDSIMSTFLRDIEEDMCSLKYLRSRFGAVGRK